jgi:hypothetical protein
MMPHTPLPVPGSGRLVAPLMNLENNAMSSLCKLNRLVGGRGVKQDPPPHTLSHSLAGSVTINAKTTVHGSPGSSIGSTNLLAGLLLYG